MRWKTYFKRKSSPMKCIRYSLACVLLLCATYSHGLAQATEIKRPTATDKASGQLIRNHLTVTAGKEQHLRARNIVAEGTITEAGHAREFTAIETAEGQRKITYRWRVKGRPQQSIECFDGTHAWKQVIKPKQAEAQKWSGRSATYFASHFWFIHPFNPPLASDYVFAYQGKAKVNGRPAYIVTGYGKANERSWFYFDQEKFLLTRWGGIGQAAGQDIYLDYRAQRFKSIEGVLLPQELDLLIQDSPYGTIRFDRIQINQALAHDTFTEKVKKSPLLRQVNR
ncbi:MAG: hypothetical protein ACI81V_000935 [Lentimonas sp.]|jgi:hypothetical protein